MKRCGKEARIGKIEEDKERTNRFLQFNYYSFASQLKYR
jgi:hypothetical protein